MISQATDISPVSGLRWMDWDSGSIVGIVPDLAHFKVGRVEATADPSTLVAGATVAQDDRVRLV